jgi:UDPglucose 6-dehydrogenase
MLATKISFMNELANLAEHCGADIESVRIGIGSDPRIGTAFIYPGVGYGGSCFPKDVKALKRSAHEMGYRESILSAVEAVNDRQKTILFSKIKAHFGDLRGKTIALWGLAFKPNTDDMREAPSRVLMDALWRAGARVRAFDPVAMPECARIYGERAELTLCKSSPEALTGADALAIVTEWREFRSPDFDAMKAALKEPVIFDGRNLYDPAHMARAGFSYYAIGRGRRSGSG